MPDVRGSVPMKLWQLDIVGGIVVAGIGALAVEALRTYRLAGPRPAPKTFGSEPFPSEEQQVQAEPGGRDE